MKVLLVEDNNDLALNITEYLECQGHIIDYAADGITGMHLALNESYNVIVLDVMLPGMNGYQFCQQLRQNAQNDIPVIMLTARDTEQDKLKGFDSGTDDYLVKPFSLKELEARINALNRRNHQQVVNKTLVVSDLEYNPGTMILKRANRTLLLKPVPRKILVILMTNTHRVVTRQEIEQEIWLDNPPDSEVLRAHIYAIRNEIDKASPVKLLHTIHGVGYRLAEAE
ncbi:MAG: response regulator transcription factor [Gammaproteobacteria bacterium]|jgi:DNA-binding response OmpR family regulator|nr:response regulator transcription factor [Gammaproteobacteria bacterium]MBT3725230.1 response regulator transcription factor [Gammaproteobacteria bacterium]MBT4195198.1 response regulator transcription factor [Gammaproteobacteria bacterium]MBT4449886.1 response regulator transcription factor [Gammaproteobacteria bacterium]MBT4863427.1 response regulator transcription factor [Gammaproteobacteria bacterium]